MSLSRRDFLKLTAVGLGTLAQRPFSGLDQFQFPDAEKLGRITVGKMDLKARPDENSQTVGAVYEDNIIPWLREVVGFQPGRINQRWVETPGGYIWGGYVCTSSKKVGQKWKFAKRHFSGLYTHWRLRIVQASLL